MGPLRSLLAARSIRRRLILFTVGVLLVAGSAYVVFGVLPAGVGAQAGESRAVTEEVRYWTPDDGWNEELRERTSRLVDVDEQLTLDENVDSAASPRGASFRLPVDQRLRVQGEPGVTAGFPPTPFFESPPETVHVAVPWAQSGRAKVGAFDTFYRTDVTERDGLELVRYQARHSSQFFVHEEKIWYRASVRTALVEPASGTVVEYSDHETLWTEPLPLLGTAHKVHELTTERERVWEAQVDSTPATEQKLLEEAKAERAEQLKDLLSYGLPGLAAGELMLWAAIARRPVRAFPG